MSHRSTLLAVCSFLALGVLSCSKDPKDPLPNVSEDENLAGVNVIAGESDASYRKLFVLNEGGLGRNNARLDFFRFSDGNYIENAYGQMNPDNKLGLGDVGNALLLAGDELWIAVNNSGLVEVLSVQDEKSLAIIPIATPRCLAADTDYVYVSSWNGAYATYGPDYSITDSADPKGLVYKIDRRSHEIVGQAETGYQPEGLVLCRGKLYVANSGGIHYSVAYSYDSTVSVIDPVSMENLGSIEVAPNGKEIFADSRGQIYLHILGDYWSIHSGIWTFPVDKPEQVQRIGGETASVGSNSRNVSILTQSGDQIFCIGTDNEFDYSAPHSYFLWSIESPEHQSDYLDFTYDGSVPYGMAVERDKQGRWSRLYITDANDYYNPGSLSAYRTLAGFGFEKIWETTTGVCPAQLLLW